MCSISEQALAFGQCRFVAVYSTYTDFDSDFADKHEDAEVVGTDLSRNQPSPPVQNLRFELDDIASEWTYPVKFDFIHIRALYGSIADWPALYQQCFEYVSNTAKPFDFLTVSSNLEPNGFLEQFEVGVEPHSAEGHLEPDNIFVRLANFAREAERLINKPIFICDKIKDAIAQAGFVEVVETRYRWPLGEWGTQEHTREIGKFNREWWLSDMENWIMALATRHMGVCSNLLCSFARWS